MASSGRRTVNLGDGRSALLDATIRVVAAKGLRGLTYRAVAKEAGVTHGLVAHHFGSRRALLYEAVRQANERSVDLSLLKQQSGNLDELAVGLAAAVRSSPDVEVFQFEVALESLREPELRRHVRRVYRRYIKEVAQHLEMAGFNEGSDALARAIFATLDGLILQQLIFGNAGETESSVERIRCLLSVAAERKAEPPNG